MLLKTLPLKNGGGISDPQSLMGSEIGGRMRANNCSREKTDPKLLLGTRCYEEKRAVAKDRKAFLFNWAKEEKET